MQLKSLIPEINLASQSPARKEVLENLGIKVRTFAQDIVEQTDKTKPDEVVQDLARQKLDAFMKSSNFDKDIPALACDTLIYFENSLIGKAHSDTQARKQISMFSGNTHQVYTGYALYYNNRTFYGSDCTDVTFRNISESELEKYIESKQWVGAAGSYHIQGLAKDFITQISGDINTVIGLPLLLLSEIITHNAQ